MRLLRHVLLNLAVAGVAVGSLLGATDAGASPLPPAATGVLVPSTFQDHYSPQIDIPASGVQDATVACPAGQTAVSAGGLTSAGGGGSAGLNGIRTDAANVAGIASARADRGLTTWVEAQVTCAPAAQVAGALSVSRETTVHSSTGEWSLQVNCPAGNRAFSGGGYFRARNGTVSHDSFFMGANTLVSGQSWKVSAVNNTFTDTLVVTARCLPESGFSIPVEAVVPLVKQPGSSIGSGNGYARCPGSTLPISGGAWITPDTAPAATHPQLTASLRVDSGQIGWFAAGFSGGDNPQLHVIVMCH